MYYFYLSRIKLTYSTPPYYIYFSSKVQSIKKRICQRRRRWRNWLSRRLTSTFQTPGVESCASANRSDSGAKPVQTSSSAAGRAFKPHFAVTVNHWRCRFESASLALQYFSECELCSDFKSSFCPLLKWVGPLILPEHTAV